jgi:hypothetical protein
MRKFFFLKLSHMMKWVSIISLFVICIIKLKMNQSSGWGMTIILKFYKKICSLKYCILSPRQNTIVRILYVGHILLGLAMSKLNNYITIPLSIFHSTLLHVLNILFITGFLGNKCHVQFALLVKKYFEKLPWDMFSYVWYVANLQMIIF